jgi:hypothetical protein
MSRTASGISALALMFAACSAPPKLGPRPSLLDGASRTPSYTTPATFRYHPTEIGELHFAAELGKKGRLFLGQNGERWTVNAEGRAEASSVFAPERLVDAVNLRPGSWLFVGAAGGVYEATDAMGPFLRSGVPPRPLARVAVTREALLGVSFDGAVLRSLDFGQTWQEVKVDGRAADLELLPDGRGLLLTVPERLQLTRDHGLTFDPIDTPSFGAWALSRQGGAAIQIDGALGSRTYTPDAASPFASATERTERSTLAPKPTLGPSAEAIATGQAAITGERYYEIAANGDGLQFRSGLLTGVLTSRPISTFDSCQNIRLTARDERVMVACSPTDESDVELSFYVSSDAGRTFSDLGVRPRGSLDELQMVLLERGFALSGVCPDEGGAGCVVEGIQRSTARAAKEKGPRVALASAKTPTLLGTPLALAASPDGRRVYAFGRRAKGRGLGVFVSTDGAKSFSGHEVSELELDAGIAFSLVRVGGDGMVSAVVRDPSSREELLLTLDEAGRFSLLASAPIGEATLAGSGLMALAFAQATGEVFESLNGGSEWHSVGRVPITSCTQGNCTLACGDQGCVIGNAITRLGWEGQRETALASPGTNSARPGMRAIGATALCRFENDSEWVALRSESYPTASSAALGGSAWFAYDAEFKTGAFDFHEMPNAATGLRTQPLAPPSEAPGKVALYFTHQIEGVATLRQVDGQGIELAWVNLFESSNVRRQRLPKQVHVQTRPTRFQTKLAEPTAVTIGRGGLYFAANAKSALYADGTSSKPLSFIDWPETIRPGRDELLRAGDANVVVRFFDGARAVAWRSVEGPSETRAVTVGLPEPGDFAIDQEMTIAYKGKEPGLYVAGFGQATSQARVMPFVSSNPLLGPPTAVPTQADLGSLPPACSERLRTASYRVVTSFESGTRHAVVISDPAEPMPVLITGEAVLHGSPDDACAAAFDAETLGSSSERVGALVFTDPDAPSWVFRRAPDATADDELEFRRMSCAFDPTAEVPEEVFSAPGTTR